MCSGRLGSSRGAGVPGLRVSRLGLELEQPWEPPARHFLKAFRFLFCLCSEVLSRLAKLPAFSAQARAEASCLPPHAGNPAQMEDIPGAAFPRGSAWLAPPGALTGAQLSLGLGWGQDGADGVTQARFGAVPLLWDALC